MWCLVMTAPRIKEVNSFWRSGRGRRLLFLQRINKEKNIKRNKKAEPFLRVQDWFI